MQQGPAEPSDAAARRAAPATTVYANAGVPRLDSAFVAGLRRAATKVAEHIVPARDGLAFDVPAGHLVRIVCTDGPQVGDLNLWNAHDLSERFFSGKTRALHATHVTTGDRLWSTLPHLRPLASVVHDTLAWYGFDADGCGVHDVIGTRCDPYTRRLLRGDDIDCSCHSNLVRALARHRGLAAAEAERHVHDVLNVFMCTGFDRVTHEYIMKPSPVRPGDHFELFAEMDLVAALSACPYGDCSGEGAPCHPLLVEILAVPPEALEGWAAPQPVRYAGRHGL